MYKHSEILQSLGEKLGLDLKFDDNGLCEIIFEENDVIAIKSFAEDHLLVLSTVVSQDMPETYQYSKMTTLLEMAFGPCLNNGGNSPVLGIDPETGYVVLYEVLTNSVFKNNDILQIVEKFLKLKVAFAKYLEPDQFEDVEVYKISDLKI